MSAPRVVTNSSMKSGQVTTWDCVWFGSYPQTEVKSSDAVYASLEVASWDADGDATVGGAKYRRISRDDATNDDDWPDDGYGSATWRYFRYEPIKWRVLKVSGSTALAVSDVALDGQRYNDNLNVMHVTWKTCSLRSWLNACGASSNQLGTDYTSRSFVGTAFMSGERGAILEITVVNTKNTSYGTPGGSDTSDHVFLLSESEAYDAAHGFAISCDHYDDARRCRPSDYAHAMGASRSTSSYFYGNCYWWLRSPGDSEYCACFVRDDGSVYRNGIGVHGRNGAVRPALSLNLSSPSVQPAGTVSSDGTVDETAPTNPSIC